MAAWDFLALDYFGCSGTCSGRELCGRSLRVGVKGRGEFEDGVLLRLDFLGLFVLIGLNAV